MPKNVIKKPAVLKKPAASVRDEVATISLEEKIQLWKDRVHGENPDAELELETSEQKQLSSKFLHALKSAPSEAKEQWETASQAPAGQKHAQKGAVVRAWLLDKSWGSHFMQKTQSISSSKSFKETEKPVSWKELQQKYEDEEIQQVLEDGGIIEVAHSKTSNVKMYIDKSNWKKEKTFVKNKEFKKNQKREVETEDDLSKLDQAFLSVDPFQEGGRSFLNDMTSSSQPPRPENPGKKHEGAMTADKLWKTVSSAMTACSNKSLQVEELARELKGNSGYGKGIKATTSQMQNKLVQWQTSLKDLYLKKDFGKKEETLKFLNTIQEEMKGPIASHASLLKQLGK